MWEQGVEGRCYRHGLKDTCFKHMKFVLFIWTSVFLDSQSMKNKNKEENKGVIHPMLIL